jgi:hypothetical protein
MGSPWMQRYSTFQYPAEMRHKVCEDGHNLLGTLLTLARILLEHWSKLGRKPLALKYEDIHVVAGDTDNAFMISVSMPIIKSAMR